MGWTFFHKPNGVKAIQAVKREIGEACAARVVAESATREAVFLVIKANEPDSKVYVPDADGTVRVIAVFAIKSAPKSEYNFGYKDMTETMGPYGLEAPGCILDAASPLRETNGPEPEYSSLRSATEYRERSRRMAKAKAAKRSMKEGAKIELPDALNFGGTMESRFTAVRCGRKVYFRGASGGFLCRLAARHLASATIESPP